MRDAAPEEFANVTENAVEFTPDQIKLILSVAFFQSTKMLLEKMNREKVTQEEADKWAEVTTIVWGKYLSSMEVGAGVWALFTIGIIMGKKKLPERT